MREAAVVDPIIAVGFAELLMGVRGAAGVGIAAGVGSRLAAMPEAADVALRRDRTIPSPPAEVGDPAAGAAAAPGCHVELRIGLAQPRHVGDARRDPLADRRAPRRADGRQSILRKGVRRVVHQRAEVVRSDVDAIVAEIAITLEIVPLRRDDVVPQDGHETVAVGAALLVPQTERMAELVHDVAHGAAVRDFDELLAALAARGRAAPLHRRKVTKSASVVRGTKRTSAEARHWAIAPVTRFWLGMVGSMVKGMMAQNQREPMAVRAARPCMSSTLPRIMSPSATARPSTTWYPIMRRPSGVPISMLPPASGGEDEP